MNGMTTNADLHALAVTANRNIGRSFQANLKFCRMLAEMHEFFTQATTVRKGKRRFYNWCKWELGWEDQWKIEKMVKLGQVVLSGRVLNTVAAALIMQMRKEIYKEWPTFP